MTHTTRGDPRWRPWVAAGLVMVVWWGVTYGFGSIPIPELQPAWFPNLGTVVTNGLSLAAAWTVAFWLHRAGWLGERPLSRSAGWVGLRTSTLWLLLPVVIVSLSYIWIGRDGVPGLAGNPGELLGLAAGMLAVGVSEETASRGIPLGATARGIRTWIAVALTSVAFGLWHLGNGIFFGQSADETWWQVLSATTFGVCFAGMRLVTASLWPGVALHALGNWTQLLSPGAAPLWYQIAVMAFELGWGVLLTSLALRLDAATERHPSQR